MQEVWRPTGSISTRILRLAGIATLVAVAGCMLIANIQVHASKRGALLGSVNAVAAVYADKAAQALADRDEYGARALVEELATATGALSATLVGADGTTLAVADTGNNRTTLEGTRGPVALLGRLWSGVLGDYVVELPLRAGADTVGRLELSIPSNSVGSSLLAGIVLQLATAFVMIWLSLLVTSRGRQFITAPITRLVTAMETVARKQDYTVRIAPAGPDEIGSLINSFNEMVSEIRVRDQRLSGHRRELQEQVIQRTKRLEEIAAAAEKSSHAKGDFLARMSHEIRTPMNGVVGMAELLSNSQLDANQRHMLQTMRASADALLEIINDILDFSKIEAEFLQILSEDFPIRDLVEEVCELLAPKAHEKGLELVLEFAPNVPAWANGDPLRIRQVVTNLVGNAIKYTDHGQVVIRLKLDGREDNKFTLKLEVEDTGAGIPEDQIDRIWEEFTQVDTFEARKHGGTGLGLAITRQLVTLMGGQVGVTSQLGTGSTFWFRLPLDSAHKVQKPVEWSLIGVKVLVVMENAAAGAALTADLEAAGAWTANVTTSHRAFEKLSLEKGFGLIIADQNLPDLSGAELLERIRATSSLAAIPVLMLTNAMPRSLEEATRTCEPDGWLDKPVRLARMRDAIDRCLGRAVDTPDVPNATATAMVRALGMKILLVEDSPVNTEVAVGMLEALGCHVTPVSNGELGVENALGSNFDAVLMDCQMPLMDGFEATRRIRSGEQQHGRKPVPIVAITANALPGDRERCLKAGMTDFVSKPFTLKRLGAVLHTLAGSPVVRTAEAAEPAERAPDSSALPVVEIGQLEELRSLGKPQLLRRTLLLFLNQSAQLLKDIRVALAADNLEEAGLAAHTLRSSALNVGGRRLAAAAAACETAARDGSLRAARAAAARLRPEFQLLSTELSALLDTKNQGNVA